MIPVIHLDDLITVDEEFSSFKEVKIGDIIAYRAPDLSKEDKAIVHRVIAIIEKGNNLTGNVVLCAPIAINEEIQEKTLTKGDANECSILGIDFPITVNNYIVKVDWRIYELNTQTIGYHHPDNSSNESYLNESIYKNSEGHDKLLVVLVYLLLIRTTRKHYKK